MAKNKNTHNKSDDLWAMRHSAEHVLTMAMMRLYGPDKVIMAMGPATDTGFYFDFDTADDFSVSENDFEKIEEEINKIIKEDLPFQREEIEIEKAKELFKNNPYKMEWLSEIEQKGEKATIYRTGDEFVDLCAGPHINSTGQIGKVKLLSTAGAYWRGSEKNKMLSRIYGTAFETQKDLDDYLHLLEEAKKRDHKKLGKELDLFTFSELVGSGLALWTPKGTLLRNILDDFVWQLRQEKGYTKVEIPHITKKELYEVSGHWEKFADELFRINTREGHEFAMKPMNCPHHTQIFARRPHSYKEMPQRYANTTMVYRDEQSGELSGLSRVRSITQDDAHVFCRKNQVKEEFERIWDIVDRFYSACGFDLTVRLSLSDPNEPEKYLGTREDWEEAENALREIAKDRGVEALEQEGEAAFYGPKLDFIAYDSLGREWQVATIQLDINMPERFNLFCINEKGEEERIVMLHAAIMGSIERFLSVIIEHFGGAFPAWLSPVQVKILPITDDQIDYANKIASKLKDKGYRVELNEDSSTLQAKIRSAQLEKVPYMMILGGKEQESENVSIRLRTGENINGIKLSEFIDRIEEKVSEKSLEL